MMECMPECFGAEFGTVDDYPCMTCDFVDDCMVEAKRKEVEQLEESGK